MPLTPKQMIKLLKKNGFKILSQNGSHVKLRNEKTQRQVIVPYHSKEMTVCFIKKISFASEVLPRSVYCCHVEKENTTRLEMFKSEVSLSPFK